MSLRDLFKKNHIGLNEERRTYEFVEGIPTNETVCENVRKTTMDIKNGPVTEDKTTRRIPSCNHPAPFEELAGRCIDCGIWICVKCEEKCAHCGKLLCGSCAKHYDSARYCSSCRRSLRFKRNSLSSLRRIHEGLSRRI